MDSKKNDYQTSLRGFEDINPIFTIGRILTQLAIGSPKRDQKTRVWNVDPTRSIFSQNYFHSSIMKYNQDAAFYFLPQFDVGDKLTFLAHNGSWSVLCGLPFSESNAGFSIFEGDSTNILVGFDGNFKIFNFLSPVDLHKWLSERNIRTIIDFRSHRHTDHYGSIGHSYEMGDRLKFINNLRETSEKISFHIIAPESVLACIDPFPYKSYTDISSKIMIRKDLRDESGQLINPIDVNGITFTFLDGANHGPPGKPSGLLVDSSELYLPDVSFSHINEQKQIILDKTITEQLNNAHIEVFRATSLHFPAIIDDLNRQQHFGCSFIIEQIFKPKFILTAHLSAADLIPLQVITNYIEEKLSGQLKELCLGFLEKLISLDENIKGKSWNFARTGYINNLLTNTILTRGSAPTLLKNDNSVHCFEFEGDSTKDLKPYENIVESISNVLSNWYFKHKKTFLSTLHSK